MGVVRWQCKVQATNQKTGRKRDLLAVNIKLQKKSVVPAAVVPEKVGKS